MRRTALTAAAVMTAALLTGCSSSDDSSGSKPSLTAQQLTDQLKAAGLPVANVTVYDAATDPNKMLGRPDGYSGKTAWDDTRIKPEDASDNVGDTSRGGSVEVFPSKSKADARAKYIQTVTGAMGMPSLKEYDYVSGGYLLRLTYNLTPDQAKQYENEFRRITA